MNSLALPEILFRIGQFIPVWMPNPDENVYNFCPKTLLACLLVCRTWNSTLRPLLWLVFDGDHMSKAPVEILKRNLVHIRIADTFPTTLLTTHLPSLTDLTIRKYETLGSGSEVSNLQFIKNNPQLQRLYWSGLLPQSPISPAPFLRLTQLTDLTLDRWHSEDGGLLKILMALSDTLTHLSLFRISGVDGSSFENLYLPHLIYLRTSLCRASSVGFEDLVCCCPNLEKLVTWPQEDSDIYRLAKNIKVHCPRVTSLTSRVCTLPEEHILELIKSCRTLVSFECRVTSIGKPLMEALLQHRSTLQSLKLSLQIRKQLAIEGLVEVLQSFTELKELSITGHAITTDAILLGGLFQQPWACLNLKVFRISGYGLTLPQENKNKSLSSLSGTSAVFGWYLHQQSSDLQDSLAMKQKSKLLWVLFQHVQNLTKLQEIHLNEVEFCRRSIPKIRGR